MLNIKITVINCKYLFTDSLIEEVKEDIKHIIDIQDDTTALLSYINDLVLLEHNLDYDKGYDDGYEKGLSDGNHIGWCECYDMMSDDD